MDATPVHEDLAVTLAEQTVVEGGETRGLARYLGEWSGATKTTHLRAHVDDVLHVIVRIGQDFRAVGDVTVRERRNL